MRQEALKDLGSAQSFQGQNLPPGFFHLLRSKVHSLKMNLPPEWPDCPL